MKGKIVKLMTDKGYGFIKAEGGGELFFHHTALRNVKLDQLRVGDDVEFEQGEGAKGPRAEDVYV